MTNTPKGFDQLDQWLKDQQVVRYQTIMVSEYTVRYGEHLLRWATNKQWNHAVVKTTALEKVTPEHHRKDDAYDADMSQLIDMWCQQIQLLSEHIDQLEETMGQLIRQNLSLSNRNQSMRTAPGIGPVLGRFWLSLFAGQDQLEARKICSRFGFAPHGRSSASSVKSLDRSTGHGNSEIRKLMHQTARSVANHNPHYRTTTNENSPKENTNW